jgi:hypothetical protein
VSDADPSSVLVAATTAASQSPPSSRSTISRCCDSYVAHEPWRPFRLGSSSAWSTIAAAATQASSNA